MNDRITIEGRNSAFGAYIARPKTLPAPAVVVRHKVFGRVSQPSTPSKCTPLNCRVPHPRRRRGCGFRRYSVNHHREFRSPILFANPCWFHDASLHAHKRVVLASFLSLSVFLRIAPKIRRC
jgi:hypothetical protein